MIETFSQQFAKLEFAPLWESLPPLESAVDPFDFAGRMAAYKTLIACMNGRGVFGAENEMNVFWGYVFQLDWQRHSGRLQFKETPPERIDPDSMWGYANYSLSVVPYIAAARLGIVPAVDILPPQPASKVEYPTGKASVYDVPAIFDEAMRVWTTFFQMAQAYEPGADFEPLRILQWRAHFASLTAVEPGIERLGEGAYARSEIDFLIGWIRMVDFLGSAAWRTDLVYMLENGVGTLPMRLIAAEDVPGKIADMDSRVNNNVRNIIGLTNQPKWRFAFNLYLWKRAMRSRQARDEVLPMLDATFNPSPQNVRERRRLLRYMLRV